MSATTTPTTFQDIYTSLLNRVRNTLGTGTPTTTHANYARQYINMANHDLHIQQNWPWAERQAILITRGTYNTGLVTIASTARTTVTGSSGTLWNTTISGMGFTNARTGGKLVVAGETEVYVVASVASDTSATLANRYLGGAETTTVNATANATYTYYEDEYALATDYFRSIDLRIFSSEMAIPILPSMEFYRLYPRNSTTLGKPQVATVIERGPVSSVALRPRVVLHPVPDDFYQIPYRYITTLLAVNSAGGEATDLSADTDEPIIPLRYRHVLIEYALSRWYRDLRDDARGREAEAAYVDLVKRMANDSAPQRDHPRLIPQRAPYVLGTAGPYGRWGRGSRWTTGTAWDEMRE